MTWAQLGSAERCQRRRRCAQIPALWVTLERRSVQARARRRLRRVQHPLLVTCLPRCPPPQLLCSSPASRESRPPSPSPRDANRARPGLDGESLSICHFSLGSAVRHTAHLWALRFPSTVSPRASASCPLRPADLARFADALLVAGSVSPGWVV